MAKKALLMILDGWGIGDHKKDDVFSILRLLIGILYWQTTLTLSCRLQAKM